MTNHPFAGYMNFQPSKENFLNKTRSTYAGKRSRQCPLMHNFETS